MKSLSASYIVLLLSLALPVHADPWSLQGLIDHSLQHNPDALSARADVQMNRTRTLAAVGNFLPSVDASGSWAQSKSTTGSFLSPEGVLTKIDPVSDQSRSAGYSVSISFPIFTGMSNIWEWFSTENQNTIMDLTLAETSANLRYQVTQAFYRVLAADEYLESSRKLLAERKEMHRTIMAFYRLGRRIALDTLQSALDINSQAAAVMAAEHNRQQMRVELRRLTGVSADDPLILGGAPAPDSPEPLVADELVSTALAGHPEIRRATLQQKQARYATRRQLAGYLPTLSGYVRYGRSIRMTTNDPFYLTPRNESESYSLSLSIPLFTGYRNTRLYQEARVNEYKQKLNLSSLQQQRRTEIISLVHNLKELYDQLKLEEESRELARLNLLKTRELFQYSQASMLEVRSAENQFIEADSQAIQSLYTYLIRWAELELAVGRSL